MKTTDIKLNSEIYAHSTRRDGKMWSRVLVLEIGTTAYTKGEVKVIFEKSEWAKSELERQLTKQGQIFWNTDKTEWVRLATIKDTAENHKATLEAQAEAQRIAYAKQQEMAKNQETFRKMVVADWEKNPNLKAIASGYQLDSFKVSLGGKWSDGKHIVEMNHTQLQKLINYVTELENKITELKKEEN